MALFSPDWAFSPVTVLAAQRPGSPWPLPGCAAIAKTIMDWQAELVAIPGAALSGEQPRAGSLAAWVCRGRSQHGGNGLQIGECLRLTTCSRPKPLESPRPGRRAFGAPGHGLPGRDSPEAGSLTGNRPEGPGGLRQWRWTWWECWPSPMHW